MEPNTTEGRRNWTWSEFARLPSEGGSRHEVIEGRLFVTPAPALRHQRVVTRLVSLLHGYVQEHDLGEVFAGPVDVLLAEGDYLEPDVVFVRKDRAHILTERGVEGPPDLVIEVTSPSTLHRDFGVKLDRYHRFGVDEYWVFDPDLNMLDIVHEGGGIVTRLGPLHDHVWRAPGSPEPLTIDLAEIFAD